MNPRIITGAVLVVVIFALTVYDICAVIFWGVDSTISRVVLRAALQSPVVAFAAGFLCGHLFAPQRIR